MPLFQYTAKAAGGQTVTGTVEAPDRRTAQIQIERMGHIPVALSETASSASSAPKARRFVFPRPAGRADAMTPRETLVFSTELSDLLASGMTLGHALASLSRRGGRRGAEAVIKSLREDIIQGRSLSEALSRHPSTFPPLYVSMVRVGEASGKLSEVMARLVSHYERIQELKEKVLMALVYPAIVLALGLATLVFSMVFVIPKFSVIFEELGSTLPLPTRFLIASSNWLVRYGWVLAAAIGGGVFVLRRAVRTPAGRLRWDALQLRVPFLRGIVAAGTFANFSRTLNTLLANGVPVLQALAIVEETVGNAVISSEIRNARERITDGTTISAPLAAGGVFPTLMTDMLAIGEQTGDMTTALDHIAHRYENELNRNVKIFTTALEPALIVVVAVLVGFVALSILMAVFNLTSGLDV